MALLNPCMKFKKFFGQKHSFEALWKWRQENFFVTCPRVCQIQDLCRKKYKKGIFSDVQWWKKKSTHFSDSTHQECMIVARIGHGSCHYHWNEIFAGVRHQMFLLLAQSICIHYSSLSGRPDIFLGSGTLKKSDPKYGQ